MWKRYLAFSCLLTLVILLDPTTTPGQPGFGKGDRERKGDRPSFGGASGSPAGSPSDGRGPGFGGPGFGRPRPEGERRSFGPPGGTPPGGATFTFGPPSGSPPGGMSPGGMPPGGMN